MNGSALSARATARLVAVCAVLAGLFFMHGLPAQGCSDGVGASAPSLAHQATVGIAGGGPDMAAGRHGRVSASRSLAHSGSTVGADAGVPGALCVSTPPPPGWAGLLALLLSVSVVGLTSALGSQNRATRTRNRRLRAPPRAGSALLMNLCVSRM